MHILNLRQFATRTALLMSLGLGIGACDKALNVEPQNSVSSDTGYTTKEDAAAGLLGVYDALQSGDYLGIAYPTIADLISQDVQHVGSFTTTYGVIGQNLASPSNIQIGNTWNAIYSAINRANYLIQESEKISDPAFPKASTIGQARAVRAYHYMNLLGLWGGTPEGFGFAGGVGVPLRLTATTAVGTQTAPVARATEAEVIAAIRADLDYAIDNITTTVGVSKSAAQALRARFELRVRNYPEALKFAQAVPATTGFATGTPSGTTTPDALWQLTFSATDTNLFAFYWFLAPGGRNELDPGTNIAAAHPAGDRRLAINVAAAGTTLKYTRTATRDDPFNIIRYAEVALTIAEAAAQTGNLTLATTQLNTIRSRAGLAPTTATTAPALITDILLQRRLELAYEGIYWFDLRRTNTVQTALPTYNERFRNLFPIPLREVQLTNDLIKQNEGYL